MLISSQGAVSWCFQDLPSELGRARGNVSDYGGNPIGYDRENGVCEPHLMAPENGYKASCAKHKVLGAQSGSRAAGWDLWKQPTGHQPQLFWDSCLPQGLRRGSPGPRYEIMTIKINTNSSSNDCMYLCILCVRHFSQNRS